MKKLMTKLSAVLLTASMAVPCFAAAESVPVFYFAAHESPDLQVDSDGTVIISRETVVQNEGFTVSTDVFIDYDDPLCNRVSPKWKSASPYLKLQNLVDPLEDSSNPLPFTYSATDADGKNISTLISEDLQYNTMSFTCYNQNFSSETPSPVLQLQGETSTDYALTTFDIFIDPDTPCGEYEIYFLTESVDYADQQVCEVYTRQTGGKVEPVETRSLKIKVVCDNIGDVNNDGMVDSSDASEILSAYAALSTNGESGLTEEQEKAADIDSNGTIDAADASNALAYYSYLSTLTENEKPMTICEYFSLNHCRTEIPAEINSYDRFGEQSTSNLFNIFRYDIDQDGENELIAEYVDSNNFEFFNVYENEEPAGFYGTEGDAILIQDKNNGEVYLAHTGAEIAESSTIRAIRSIYPFDNVIVEYTSSENDSTGEITSNYYVNGNSLTKAEYIKYVKKLTYISGEGGQQSIDVFYNSVN